jgi:hypothetical protein
MGIRVLRHLRFYFIFRRLRRMGVRQGVAMDSLEFHSGDDLLFFRPAGRPSLKQPNGCFRGGAPTGRAAYCHLLPLWTPDAVRLCFDAPSVRLI